MEKIIEDQDNLVSVSWKDQKEGIVFVENPSYKQKVEKNLSKKEQLENEINNLKAEISQRTEEIEKLKEKEEKYIDDIQNLKDEYNENKKKVLDEGHALGFADTVLREFKWIDLSKNLKSNPKNIFSFRVLTNSN